MESIRSLNERNQRFWEQQSLLADQRIANPTVAQIAFADLKFDSITLPLYFRKTLEQCLERAEQACRAFDAAASARIHTEFSRRGGKAAKPDKLTKFIRRQVEITPDLDMVELEKRIGRSHEFEIKDRYIIFAKSNGVEKLVPVLALKDRLYRIKKDNHSR